MVKNIFFILLIITVALVAVMGSARFLFFRKVKGEVQELFREVKVTEAGRIKETDLYGLPEPVQRYLRFTGIIGKNEIRCARFRQQGQFRTDVKQKWFPLDAAQYVATEMPGFIWFAHMHMAPLVTVSARDRLSGGRGNMLVKLLSLIRLADAAGKEIDQGTLLRYLGEMVWYPTAFLNRNIRWEPVDSRSARAIFTDGDMTVSGLFIFGDGGEVTSFKARRYMSSGNAATLEDWSAEIHDYREVDGIRIPRSAEVIWHLEAGDFSYARLEISDAGFNIPEPY